jgi:hypothetical protein
MIWRERYRLSGATFDEARRRADLEVIARTADQRAGAAIGIGIALAMIAIVAMLTAVAYDRGQARARDVAAAPCVR